VRIYRLLIIVLVFSLLAMPGVASAQEAAQGKVEGQVINGTEGGGNVAGVEVTLISYNNDAIYETRTVTADSDGRFLFEEVNPSHQHVVSASYMDVHYYNPVMFEEGETIAYVEVGVCDLTESNIAIMADLSHIILDVQEDDIEITEMFWLVNNGDRTYKGTYGSLIFTLPEGAKNFKAPESLMPDFELLDSNTLAYLVPFPPGERQIVFSYLLPKPESDEAEMHLELDFPVSSFSLMVGGKNIEIAASQLSPAEPVTTNTGKQFIHLRGESLPPDTVLDVHLYGLSGSKGLSAVVLWVIAAIIIVCIVVYIFWRKKKVTSKNG